MSEETAVPNIKPAEKIIIQEKDTEALKNPDAEPDDVLHKLQRTANLHQMKRGTSPIDHLIKKQ